MKASARYPELDIFRGIAIVLMVLFHTVFDIYQLTGNAFLDPDSFAFSHMGTLAALGFFIAFGMSAVPAAEKHGSTFYIKSFKRGGLLLLFAFIITGASYIIPLLDPIWFGVLHFLGVSSFLLPFLVRLSSFWLLATSLGSLLLGYAFRYFPLDVPFFLPLGIPPPGFMSSDYYPIFPWLFAILFGIWCGKLFYSQKQPAAQKSQPAPLSVLAFFGRHALFIYLAHQPLIYGLLVLFTLGN